MKALAILVTGGAGYIGSHTCVELHNAGYDTIVVDNLTNGSITALKRVQELTGKEIRFYYTDLQDKDKLEKVFKENSIDAVIHLAAFKSVEESVMRPLEYYENNIGGIVALCQMMQKYDVKKLVYSSSAAVYAASETPRALTEDSPLGPKSPYGRTKLIGEEILRDLYKSDNKWGIAILRYFNPAGAHPSGRIGEDPKGSPNNLTPYIAQVAIGKREMLQIYGNDYPTRDGTGVRDYIHVVDLANGHVKALEKILESSGIVTYNLGTGKGYSVLEMIAVFEKVSGRKIPYTIVDRRPGDVAVCYADPSKAREELNWVARRSIEEMCADAWNWQLNNPNGYGEE